MRYRIQIYIASKKSQDADLLGSFLLLKKNIDLYAFSSALVASFDVSALIYT